MVCTEEAQHHVKKKTSFYKERDENLRDDFTKIIAQYPKDRLVYLDESGIDSFVYRKYGRAPRGENVFGEVSGKRYARESFIAALSGKSLIAPLCFTGTCDTVLFNFWLEQFLSPQLKPGQIVILDNASFHKSEKSKTIIKEAGCDLLFLPPYSPDLNPIEKAWAYLKAKIKAVVNEFSSLKESIDHVFQKVSYAI